MRSFLAIICLFGCLFWAVPSFGITIGLGPTTSFPTSSVDHLKYGPRLRLEIFETSSWSVSAAVQISIQSLTTVNPGATGNSTAPDQKESSTGSTPTYARSFLLAPWHLVGGRVGAGVQSYFADLASKQAAAVPLAPSGVLEWILWDTSTWLATFSLPIGFYPFGDFSMIEAPEISLLWRWSSHFGLQLTALAVCVQAFGGGSSALLAQPSANLALVARF